MSLVDEAYMVSDFHNGIHVVGIDDSGDLILSGDFLDQAVYDDGCGWIQAGVRLVAEKIFRIQRYGPCDTYPFLHTSRQLGRIKFVGTFQVNSLEAEIHPFQFLFKAPFRKEIHREHDVLLHGCKVEQGAFLEKHSHFLAEEFPFREFHLGEIPFSVKNLSPVRLIQAHKVFQQHGLSASAGSDDKGALSRAELDIDVFQYRLAVEFLV